MFGELEVSQEPLERKQLFQQVLRAKHLLTMRVFGCNPGSSSGSGSGSSSSSSSELI